MLDEHGKTDYAAYTFCVLERLKSALHRRDVCRAELALRRSTRRTAQWC